jgi:hypothetical protein
MEKDAFKRLKELSLPFPKTFQLEQLIEEASSDNLYFLRYQQETDLPKYVSSEYLREHSIFFRRLVAEDQISQIAETVITTIGGCIVTRGTERYVELVSGHVSGLLSYGWCYARAYFGNSDTAIVLTPQMEMVEQVPGVNRIVPVKVIDSDMLNYLVRYCETLLRKIDSDYLLEFIVSDKHQVYFVDIKDYKWQIEFAALVTESKEERLLYRHNGKLDVLANVYDGSFSLNNLEAVNQSTTIRLADQALLSHFITYSLNKGIAGIIR